jgi:2-methylcitrate dehydratase PrpD
VNGTAAHALDFDDLSMQAMGGHPSAPLLPALLAVGEMRAADGRDLLTAFVAGFEAQARIGLALGPEHYARGFHSTATIGAFGAALGTAWLRRLAPDDACTAVGIAAAQSSGLKAMFGSMCKPLQTGRAAAAGVLAADLAERGYTSADEGLFGAQAFAATHSETPDPAQLTVVFGRPWHILDDLFKAHASCYGTHATIDAVLRLRDGLPGADVVDAIEVRVPTKQLSVCAIPAPRTGLEGKFSLTYTAALALQRGRADEQQFTDEAVWSPELLALRERVTVVPDDDLPVLGSTVTIALVDGRRLTATVDSGQRAWRDDPGEQGAPLERKFRGLVGPVLGHGPTERLIETISALDAGATVRDLLSATGSTPR